jgi:hypothetical protein
VAAVSGFSATSSAFEQNMSTYLMKDLQGARR